MLVPGPVQAAAAPSSAKTQSDPLAGLTLHPEWGTVTGKSGVLKRGCHKYTYSYSINPPEGIWAIEIFISGRGSSTSRPARSSTATTPRPAPGATSCAG